MRFKKVPFRILILIIVLSSSIYPQQSELSKGVNYLSEFIASDYFLQLKKDNTDTALVDSIYIRAINFYEKDYEEALLALTFATIPYSRVPFVIPLLKIRLYYPLISASDSISNLKESKPSIKIIF